MSSLAPVFKGQNPTSLMSSLNISRPKATRLSLGLAVERKPNERKLTESVISVVAEFFDRDEISRVNPGSKTTTKHGPRREMQMYIGEAYELFIEKYKDIKISHSSFWLLKPKNVKNLSATQLITCLCVYCQNVRLKLKKLNIPKVNSEYDLFTMLICQKEDGKDFRNVLCISKGWPLCNDWKLKITSHMSNRDMTKETH